MMVRRATVLDIPECLAIAKACYRPFDVPKVLRWAEGALLQPDVAFFRTEDAWGCVMKVDMFYEEKPRAIMLFLAGRHGKAWQALAVLRTMLNWAQAQGCASFDFGEDTGMRMDVMARRIGAQPKTTWQVPLAAQALRRAA